jgi:hypothetical protein
MQNPTKPELAQDAAVDAIYDILKNLLGEADTPEARSIARDVLAAARDQWEDEYWAAVRGA